jgi:hypothetical protein
MQRVMESHNKYDPRFMGISPIEAGHFTTKVVKFRSIDINKIDKQME